MKIIIVCVAVAVAGFYGASKYLDNPSVWRSPGGSTWSSQSGGKDLRVDTPAGKMYPGVPKFGETTINGKRYYTITTVKSR